MSDADFGFLRTFRPTVNVELGQGFQMFCVHGSPRSNIEIVTALTADDDLGAMLQGVMAHLVAGGHTHAQLLRRYEDRLIINPGSVGLPFERARGGGPVRNPPWAEYAIVEEVDERLSVQFRRVPIDLNALEHSVESSGMPYAAWWLHGWGIVR